MVISSQNNCVKLKSYIYFLLKNPWIEKIEKYCHVTLVDLYRYFHNLSTVKEKRKCLTRAVIRLEKLFWVTSGLTCLKPLDSKLICSSLVLKLDHCWNKSLKESPSELWIWKIFIMKLLSFRTESDLIIFSLIKKYLRAF